MSTKENVAKIGWSDMLDMVEKNQGVAKKSVNESFKAVDTEIKAILKGPKRPSKVGDALVIKTPICSIAQKYVEESVEVDSKGRRFKCSPRISVAASYPKEYIPISNEGFELTKTLIEEDTATKKK